MRRTDRFRACVAMLLAAVASATLAADTLLRHRADIVIEHNAAFVKLPLPPSAYARTTQGGLQDLRVVDARGERVPFALLAPRPDEQQARDAEHAATLYPLPPRPAAGGTWVSPVELTVDGDRISVKRRGNVTDGGAAPTRSPGWLIDLGEHRRDDPWPHSLRLQWSGPGEFSAAYRIETSSDLRDWRAGGGGQVMALMGSGSAGALSQPLVPLSPAPGRFVRLVWAEPGAAPALTGAAALSSAPRSVTLDAPTELSIDAVAESSTESKSALTFDLGAPLPLLQIDLQLGAGTRVAPVRLQARTRADEAWQTLPGAVFYQFDSGGETRHSPPVALQRTVRYLRVVTDERAAPLDAQQTRLRARAQLSSLVFAAQGQPPYALLAGSAQASAGALPLATLVPNLDEERSRFGRASLGAWSEVREAARQADAEQRRAALRPWLLWAVLLAGVAGLAFMVWRLARAPRG